MAYKTFFPRATLAKMTGQGLSEYDINDVINNGEWITLPGGSTAAIKKYNGYEIGAVYVIQSNGEYAIKATWKKNRR